MPVGGFSFHVETQLYMKLAGQGKIRLINMIGM